MTTKLPLAVLSAAGLLAAACELDRAGSHVVATNDSGLGGAAGLAGVGGAGLAGGNGGAAGASGLGGVGAVAGGGEAGSAGFGPDPCDQLCTDPNATCLTGNCNCNSGFVNIDADADPKTAICVDVTVSSVTVEVGIGHTRCGNLTIKLRNPDGTVLTLMSRPGAAETGDDGGGDLPGSAAAVDKAYPLTFEDGAAVSSENMGADMAAGVVCKNGAQICTYGPDAGMAGGPTTFAGAFAGKAGVGDWTLCVGDSHPSALGKLDFWVLRLGTPSGEVALASPVGLGIVIPDDGYDGTMPSMACHTLTKDL
jgi:hypothetical protein